MVIISIAAAAQGDISEKIIKWNSPPEPEGETLSSTVLGLVVFVVDQSGLVKWQRKDNAKHCTASLLLTNWKNSVSVLRSLGEQKSASAILPTLLCVSAVIAMAVDKWYESCDYMESKEQYK